MPPRFVGSAPENVRAGRPAGFTPEAIVLHRTGGSAGALRARFNDPAVSISAHYVVCRDGRVEQYVAEGDTAFHAGLALLSTWRLLRPNVNPNFYTIGVELEGSPADDWPDAQVEATATLVADIARRWQIAVDADHVIAHSAIRSSSRCPADSCPLARIIESARGRTLAARVPSEAVVHTLARTNLRHRFPSLQAPIARVIPPNSAVVVSGFIDNGDRVQGNPFWYTNDEDGFIWAGATDVPNPTGRETGSPPSPGTTDGMEGGRRDPGSPEPVELDVAVDRTTLVLPPKEIVLETTHKDLIVLHFTAGRSARSAFDTWRNDPQRIATAYLVDVDGTIYEVFHPSFWAAHLGVKGTKNLHDRRSIGIEIANVGPLQRSSDDPAVLNWWPPKAKGAPEFTTKFCTLAETDKYVAAEYRTKNHFASFPALQVDAVAALVRGLCRQFSIAPALPALSRRFEFDTNAFATYKGVCTHANFRQDKWDIGPAFPWDRLGL